MFVRFLRCGIGHKGQIHCAPSSNEVGNEFFLDEDDLDSQNITRIIRGQTVTDIDNGRDDDNTQDNVDNLSATGDSDTDSDGDDDLDGHF